MYFLLSHMYTAQCHLDCIEPDVVLTSGEQCGGPGAHPGWCVHWLNVML